MKRRSRRFGSESHKTNALVLADKSDLKDSPHGGCRACYPVARIV